MSMTRVHRRWTTSLVQSADHARRLGSSALARALACRQRPSATVLGVEALAEAFENAPFGFAVLDEQGRYRLVNHRQAAVAGISVAEHMGRRPADFDSTGGIDQHCVEQVLRSGRPGHVSSTAVPDHASGNERYWATSCYPLHEESGRVTAVGVITLDVTDQELARRRAEQLLHFAGLVGGVSSFDDLAAALVRFISTTFRARCAVGEVSGDRLRIAAVQGFTPDVCGRWMRDGFAMSEPRPITAAIRERTVVEVRSRTVLPARYAGLDWDRAETGDTCVIAIPLQDPANDLGPCAVVRLSWPHCVELTHDSWTTLRTVVSMAELALSRIALNARQQAATILARVAEETDALAERRRIAIELLQRAALPAELPSVPGVVLDAIYRPALTVAGVGGDWYDAFALGEHRLGLVIADVAGHGEEAASFMVQVRNALRAMALEHEQPHLVLERINAVALSLRDDYAPFVTCCYAVLDTRERSLVWSTAGHFDPLIVRADRGAWYAFSPHRPPLTVTANPNYVSSTIGLETGDRVVMFTDGLIERRGESIDASLTRLAQHAAAVRGEKIGDCLQSLLDVVDERFDDMALICAELVDAGL
jgi:PAS domain S-box-containing protein